MNTALNARSVDAILMGSAQLGDAIRRFPTFVAVASRRYVGSPPPPSR